MRRVWIAWGLLTTFLAGCAGGSPEEAEVQAIVDDEEYNAFEASATTGVIRGVVIDDAIRPLVGATIVLMAGEDSRNTTSADSGAFGFADLQPGTYFMEVSKPGFSSVQASADVVAGVDEPEIVKVVLTINPTEKPYFVVENWGGFIECSFRVAVPGVISTGVNACNGVGNQDVNYPIEFDMVPSYVQAEMIWDSTQNLGSGLSFVVGPDNCDDFKYSRADGESPLVIRLNETQILEGDLDYDSDEPFDPATGLCYRSFSFVAAESGGTFGLVNSQQFEVFFHSFYNMLPPEGWQFSVDGDPPQP